MKTYMINVDVTCSGGYYVKAKSEEAAIKAVEVAINNGRLEMPEPGEYFPDIKIESVPELANTADPDYKVVCGRLEYIM